ncbi:AraC family transcriptional regulator ligand-binding domain-containing protein [Thalassospira lucentensis]|uniref:AraC family transcriptional regulator n=1 Tax=Thalassospira lucentensis TaxID=168935 RepID=UPI003D2F1D77
MKRVSGAIDRSVLNSVMGMLGKSGIDHVGLSARAGLGGAGLFISPQSTPLMIFTTMLELASDATNDPALGLMLGDTWGYRGLGKHAEMVLTAQTLGHGLEKFARFFPTLQGSTSCSLSVEDGQAKLSYRIAEHAVRTRTQDAIFSEASFHSLLLAALGHDWQPNCIDFEHRNDRGLSTFRHHFGCQVRLGQRENAIFLPAELLNKPMKQANSERHWQLVNALQSCASNLQQNVDLPTATKAWIVATLCRHCQIDVHDAADEFSMSLRSFQRELDMAGTSFRSIRDEVRGGIASDMLRLTSFPIPDIAEHLGYSELSAFSRGFKSMTGTSPGQFRRELPRPV